MSDPWFDERELERWTPELPADELAELDRTLAGFTARLSDPATPPLHIELADGTAYEHQEIIEIAGDSADVLATSVRGGSMDGDELGRLIAAATNLQVIAVTLFETLAATGLEGKDDAMGLASVLSRMLQKAFNALDRSVTRTPEGKFRLRWTEDDRILVQTMTRDLDAALESDDPSLVRLFPPAYGTDETRSREYAAIARDELIESRRAALATVESALARDEIDADELHALMRAVNDLRLVIGTDLDVSEEDPRRPVRSGPDAERWQAYERLTQMLGQIVGALSS